MKCQSGLISRLFFFWVTPFIRRNITRPLTMEELIEAPSAFDVSSHLASLKELIAASSSRPFFLIRALLLNVRREIAKTTGCALLLLATGLLTPLVLRRILLALEGKYIAPEWAGDLGAAIGLAPANTSALLSALLLFILGIVGTLSVHHLFYNQVGISIKVHASLRALIYDKALRLARSERGEASSGAILTLTGTDSGRIFSWLQMLHAIWYHPLQVTLALVLLYRLVGVAAIFGTASLALPLIIASALVRSQNRIRREVLAITDQRVGFTAEVLGHIKTVKFQAWERPLSERILALRGEEVQRLRRVNLLSSLAGLASNLAPTAAMVVTFSVLVLRGGTLDAATVFPAMSLILLLRFAINSLPDTFINTLEALLSASRIESFLKRRDFAPRPPVRSSPYAIELEDASFEWSPSVPALHVKQLRVNPGELVAIVGGVGSGKSALLLSILGELSLTAGSVSANGTLGYVAQQPWIVSDTVRNNILAGEPFSAERYERALAASALGPDLKDLPQGDATMIGERGVNLSGGQRQRVALARALYLESDIYLLDDPLSALDTRVANEVFELLVCGELAGRARLLVTHRLEYALRADRVIVVERGIIVESGTPQELKGRSSRFTELLDFHSELSHVAQSTMGHSEASDGNLSSSARPEAAAAASRSVVEVEERDVGAVDRRVLRTYMRRFAPGLLGLVVVAVVFSRHIASVATDLWLALFSRGPLPSHKEFILGYAGLLTTLAIFHFARWYLFLDRGLKAGQASHEHLLQGVLAAPLRFFEANPTGRIVNRFSRDLDTVEGPLPRTLQDTCSCVLDVLVVFILLSVLEPYALILLLPLTLVYARYARVFRPTSREAQRLESISRSPIFALFSESLSGTDTLRASGLTEQFAARMRQYLSTNVNATYTINATNRWLGIRLELLAALVLLAAAITVSLLCPAVIPASVAGLLLVYSNFGGPMNWVVRSLVMAESSLTSFERMEYYANTPSETRGGNAAPINWPAQGDLRLSALTVQYRPDLPPALDSVSCSIPAGSRVGIVGRTGSGKSTLILALGRLLEPSEGHIELDRVNTSTLSLEALRSAITVVPQEPVLFSGPLRDSLDPFRTSSDAEITEALGRVELDRFVAELPGGLSATVNEGGSNFSCGQRQLFCLARALLRRCKVIVLDEATANIDVETDSAIQRTIRREFGGATVLVVAHRLGTVIDSDLMLVLEHGRVAEFGAPAQLLASPNSALAGFLRELQRGAG